MYGITLFPPELRLFTEIPVQLLCNTIYLDNRTSGLIDG